MRLTVSKQRGDTIVEVLIAIAVIGAVLSSAYVVVNSNTANNQAAQERSVAVKIAESQLELLRSYVTSTNTLPTGSFCLESSGANVSRHAISSPLPAPNNTGYPPQCLIDDSRYVAGIRASTGNRFTIFVNWDAPGGDRAQVSIAYKVYLP